MMNSNQPPPAPMPTARDIETLLALVDILASPAASATRIKEFAAAASAAKDLVEQAEKRAKELSAAREQAERELDVAREQHNTKLSQDRETFEALAAQRTVELDEREKRLKELQAKAEADAAKAATIRVDMERRIRLVTEAA